MKWKGGKTGRDKLREGKRETEKKADLFIVKSISILFFCFFFSFCLLFSNPLFMTSHNNSFLLCSPNNQPTKPQVCPHHKLYAFSLVSSPCPALLPPAIGLFQSAKHIKNKLLNSNFHADIRHNPISKLIKISLHTLPHWCTLHNGILYTYHNPSTF